MKDKLVNAYMDVAYRFAKLSHARRLHVGAIIVKDDRIISIGYNGMPAGWENNCELTQEDGALVTKPEVLHAEMNALMKLAKSTESGDAASIFITHAPCMDCAKSIYQAGILEVYYSEEYRSSNGITFLKQCDIRVKKLDRE
jgi:dCMP deaminase